MVIKQVVFDQDGVLANFIQGFREIYNLSQDWIPSQYFLELDINISSEEMWQKISEHEDWWLNLKPLTEGIELLRWIRNLGIDTTIATAPPLHDADVARQKVLWLKQHIPEMSNNYAVITRKELLAAPGRILIDDYEKNIEKWNNFGGYGILLKQPFNDGITYNQIKMLIKNIMKGTV